MYLISSSREEKKKRKEIYAPKKSPRTINYQKNLIP